MSVADLKSAQDAQLLLNRSSTLAALPVPPTFPPWPAWPDWSNDRRERHSRNSFKTRTRPVLGAMGRLKIPLPILAMTQTSQKSCCVHKFYTTHHIRHRSSDPPSSPLRYRWDAHNLRLFAPNYDPRLNRSPLQSSEKYHLNRRYLTSSCRILI